MSVSPVGEFTARAAPAKPSPPGRLSLAAAPTRRPYPFLLAALPLPPLANGTSSAPLSAWLAPALLVCAASRGRVRRRL